MAYALTNVRVSWMYQVFERENNSVAEVLENLELVHRVLVERKNKNFMSLTVKRLLVEKREVGYEDECNNFFPKLQTSMRDAWSTSANG